MLSLSSSGLRKGLVVVEIADDDIELGFR